MSSAAPEKDKSKVHKLSLKGSAKLVAEFVSSVCLPSVCRKHLTNLCNSKTNSSSTPSIPSCTRPNSHSLNIENAHSCADSFMCRRFQRGVYPAEDFTAVKKYGLNMLVSSDDQVRAYIKKIMSQLDKWMIGGKISKLVIVITNKDTGEHVERWQFDVSCFPSLPPLSPNTPNYTRPMLIVCMLCISGANIRQTLQKVLQIIQVIFLGTTVRKRSSTPTSSTTRKNRSRDPS